MKAQRFEEIMAGMNSFGKEAYHKSELISEMFALQQEVVEATFNGEHAATADLKIWDVERHLEQLNDDCGHVADDALTRFKEGSKTLCNLIKAEISGNRGEHKTFRTLEYIHSQNKILKNVELTDGETRTEIDAVVITPKCVTIVEVKNTGKNIFIDEEGNYYRTGEFLKWDSNIAEKMSVKESLLSKVLENAGYKNIQIRSVVVFTDNRIEVQNKYSMIRTCFVSQLAHIIDGYGFDDVLSVDEMESIQGSIEEAACKESYAFEFDVQQYKIDFANLMVALESANDEDFVEAKAVVEPDRRTAKVQKPEEKKISFKDVIKAVFTSKEIRYAESTAAAVAITVASSLIAANTINKGGL